MTLLILNFKTMVKIVDYKTYQKEDGTEFYALVVQGGVEVVKSQETNRTYLTANTVSVPCTFNEITCQSLAGQDLPGVIKKVEVEPYEYTIPDTGEIITLSHRRQYMDDDEAIIMDNLVQKELVV